MSRSVKKHGFIKHADSEKDWKKMYHKKARAQTRVAMSHIHKGYDDVIMPNLKIDYSDIWDSKQDGPKYRVTKLEEMRK